MWAGLIAVLMGIGLPLVVNILLGLGVGIVTYTGADYAVSTAETYLFNQMGTLSTDIYNMIAMMGAIDGIKIIFSAYSARVAVQATMASFTRLRVDRSALTGAS